MAVRSSRSSARHRKTSHPLARALGERVRELRVARGWNFDGFVEQLAMGRGYVSELERGLVMPSLESLHRIADALEVTVADLLMGDSIREQLFRVTATLSDLDVKQLLREAEKRSHKKATS